MRFAIRVVLAESMSGQPCLLTSRLPEGTTLDSAVARAAGIDRLPSAATSIQVVEIDAIGTTLSIVWESRAQQKDARSVGAGVQRARSAS